MTGAEIGALTVASLAFVWTVYSDVSTRRRIRRERDERTSADAREERSRAEEIGLLREQVGRAKEEREEDRAAIIVAECNYSHVDKDGATYVVRAQNVGRSTALRVLVWLAVSGPEALDSSAALTELTGFAALVPRDDPQGISLTQPHPLRGEKCSGLIVARWSDGNGEHVKVLGTSDVYI